MIPAAQISLKTPRSSRMPYIARASFSSTSNSSRCSSGTLSRISSVRSSASDSAPSVPSTDACIARTNASGISSAYRPAMSKPSSNR
jgi:hypothetical protein